MGAFVNVLVYFVVLVATYEAAEEGTLNDRPIIGILAQSIPHSILDGLQDKNYTSYIAASYVKYIEMAGARVVPILTYQTDEYYHSLAQSLNGFLFPGGGVSITNSSGYGAAGQIIYDHVLAANAKGIHLPLWGTCLGFEMLTYLAANCTKLITRCSAENIADSITLQSGYEDSRLFQQMPTNIAEALTGEKVTINFHSKCITPQNFTQSGLSKEFYLLATSYDSQGLEYVALMEHKSLPVFGSQFHPEKNPFEWDSDDKHCNIPHTSNAILVAQYFANFFVNQARLNNQSFSSEKEEENFLIYNYNPLYTAKIGASFEQTYLFRNNTDQRSSSRDEESETESRSRPEDEATTAKDINQISITNFHYGSKTLVPLHLIHYFQYNISNSILAK